MKQLNLDEMLEVLQLMKHPAFPLLKNEIERTGSMMASMIADGLGVEAGLATFEGTGFAGTCAPFWGTAGQRCPEPLRDYDATEWTDKDMEPIEEEAEHALDLDPKYGNRV